MDNIDQFNIFFTNCKHLKYNFKEMYTQLELNPCKTKLLDLTIVLETIGHVEKPR